LLNSIKRDVPAYCFREYVNLRNMPKFLFFISHASASALKYAVHNAKAESEFLESFAALFENLRIKVA